MVIDTSAVLAILQNEPERVDFVAIIDGVAQPKLSIVSFVEASFLLESRFGQRGLAELDDFVEQAEIMLVSVEIEQARLARQAFSRFGP